MWVMRLLYDYFPIICFFVAYQLGGIYVATAVTMGASCLQILLLYLFNQKIETRHWAVCLLIVMLGSATLFFHNPLFVKLKPSVVYWLFGLSLLLSRFLSDQPLIERLLGEQMELPKSVWLAINQSWAYFFIGMGCLNLYVVYHFTTHAWVNFKLFGTLGLTLLFSIAQMCYIMRYLKQKQAR